MNNQITIIGSNSILYKNLKTQLFNHNVKELSHKDLTSVKEIVNPIVFSYSKKCLSENLSMMDLISKKATGKIIYISTTAVLACAITDKYSYPINKKNIENHIILKDNISIIRIGLVENLFDKAKICGQIKYSSIAKIISCIKEAYEDDTKIINAWETIHIKGSILNNAFLKMEFFLLKIFRSYFFYTRPFDLLFKLMKFNNYGYTFLSNVYKEKDFDQVVIGSGMAAMGAINAISENRLLKLEKTLLIESFNNLTKHTDINNNNKALEFKGFGGSSNFWHGVISKYVIGDKAHSLLFKKWFSHFYNISDTFLNDGYSFIPKFPLRPRKLILEKVKKQKQINDTVILIERDLSCNSYIIHTIYNSFVCRNLFMCSGTFSSLQLLFDSGIMQSENIQIDDHMVGYFAQLRLNKRVVLEKPIHYKTGHFKKFHKIKLTNKKSLYVNLRPAYLSFQDISEASKYRDFFSQRSINIIGSLLSKLKLPLILEAIYNKFGLQLFSTSCYNITGHIEVENALTVKLKRSKAPEIQYNIKSITFSDKEKSIINEYFKNITGFNCSFPSEIKISPGIHYLNAKDEITKNPLNLKFLENSGLYTFGTYLFNESNPEHPTFDLFINSFNKIKTIK